MPLVIVLIVELPPPPNSPWIGPEKWEVAVGASVGRGVAGITVGVGVHQGKGVGVNVADGDGVVVGVAVAMSGLANWVAVGRGIIPSTGIWQLLLGGGVEVVGVLVPGRGGSSLWHETSVVTAKRTVHNKTIRRIMWAASPEKD